MLAAARFLLRNIAGGQTMDHKQRHVALRLIQEGSVGADGSGVGAPGKNHDEPGGHMVRSLRTITRMGGFLALRTRRVTSTPAGQRTPLGSQGERQGLCCL